MSPQITRKLLQTVSNLLHPLFMMTYGTAALMYFTPLYLLPSRVKLFLLGVVFFFTCLVPVFCITVLYLLRIVKHWALRDRGDRGIPLALNAVSYIVCARLLSEVSILPPWALAIYYGGAAMAVLGWIISLWWKVSAHAMGIASLATACFGLALRFPFAMPAWLPLLLIVLAGLLCSIRLYLQRHTLMQVTVGAAIGEVAMIAAFWWGL